MVCDSVVVLNKIKDNMHTDCVDQEIVIIPRLIKL